MTQKRCTILSIGNELLLGLTVDTNAHFLCSELDTIGWTVREIRVLPDITDRIAGAVCEAAACSDAVILTGGLGPTNDDRTRAALAQALKSPLEERPELIEQIQARFRQIHRPMTPANRVQGNIPAAAKGIQNDWGTAPGIAAHIGTAQIFSMPGVPREMMQMFYASVQPALEAQAKDQYTCMRRLHIFGVSESTIGERIADFMQEGANPEVGTTVHHGTITVRLRAHAESEAKAQALLAAPEAEIRKRLAPHIFGCDGKSLAHAVYHALKEKNATLALAESCTGGMIANLLVALPGASDILKEAIVCYSNESKQNRLKVPEVTLATHGAVSLETAEAMARGARKTANATFGLAVTGIVGPGGGTQEKPVGTICFAVADAAGVYSFCSVYGADRAGNRKRAASAALDLLHRKLTNISLPGASIHD